MSPFLKTALAVVVIVGVGAMVMKTSAPDQWNTIMASVGLGEPVAPAAPAAAPASAPAAAPAETPPAEQQPPGEPPKDTTPAQPPH
jgi:hypothetical protein